MNETEVFELADRTLARVVGQVRPDQWETTLPPIFATASGGDSPTVRTVVGQHAYEDAWVPDMVAGRTMAEVGETAYQGDLLGEDPASAFGARVEAAIAAVRALPDLEGTVHCSFGDFTAREFLWQCNSFRGLRAYDLAEALGVQVSLPEQLVQGLWDELSPVADEWRQWGVFPAAVPVSAEAPLLDRLLGLTGRQPQGVPA